ncbi:MAG: hypothetical protein ACI4P8_02975 [Akkermansia sp.]
MSGSWQERLVQWREQAKALGGGLVSLQDRRDVRQTLTDRMRRFRRRMVAWQRSSELWEPCAFYRAEERRLRSRRRELLRLPLWKLLLTARACTEQGHRWEEELDDLVRHAHECRNCRGTSLQRYAVRRELRLMRDELRRRLLPARYAKWILLALVPLCGQLFMLLFRQLLG